MGTTADRTSWPTLEPACMILLATLALGRVAGWWDDWAESTWFDLSLGVLATPVMIRLGRDHVLDAPRNGYLSTGLPAVLGAAVAYLTSAAAIVRPGLGSPLHFATAAAILVLFRLGRTLEARACRTALGEVPGPAPAGWVTSRFVPYLLLLALTAPAWGSGTHADLQTALMRSVLVLVIISPGALVQPQHLATAAGLGLAARLGLGFRDAHALRRARDVNLLLVDESVLLDGPRPDVAAAVAGMEARGIDVVLLSADEQDAADAKAREVGINQALASVRPEEKTRIVSEFHADCAVVGLAGPGREDAAALAAADVGFAVGGGDADVSLGRDGLPDVSRAIRLSGRVVGTYRRLKVLAVGYHVLLVLAVLGVVPIFRAGIPPIAAATLSAACSLAVVLGSLRIGRP